MMKKKDAFVRLYKDKAKIRYKDWESDRYIYLLENSIIWNDGDIYHHSSTNMLEEGWEIYSTIKKVKKYLWAYPAKDGSIRITKTFLSGDDTLDLMRDAPDYAERGAFRRLSWSETEFNMEVNDEVCGSN